MILKKILAMMCRKKDTVRSNVNDVITDFAEAWNRLDTELIIKHLDPSFQYDSQWVYSPLDYNGYIEYIRGKFQAIEMHRIPVSAEIVDDPYEGGQMIRIVQSIDGKDSIVYYRIKINNGKVVKGDLCMF